MHTRSRGTYGRPRLLAGLRQRGERTSARRVARLMRQLGLRGVRKGGYRPRTTDSRHQLTRWPNRLREMLRDEVLRRIVHGAFSEEAVDRYAAEVAGHERDPYSLIEGIVAKLVR